MASILSQELKLPCGAILKNRLAKASMSEGLSDMDNRPTSRMDRLYERWSKGGAGLLLTGNVMIDGRFLERVSNAVARPEFEAEFRSWAKAGTVGGNHLWMQISHPGRQTTRVIAPTPLGPSEVAAVKMFAAFGRPRAMTEEEILGTVTAFADTAALAQRTGFTGVEIHGAHGYLISQFLSPLTNLRQDRWGGSLENRARFLIEVVRAVRRRCGPSFPVGLKLNSADFQRGGFSESDAEAVVGMLNGEAVDLLEISGGNYETQATFSGAPEDASKAESTRKREAFFLGFAAKIKKTAAMPLMLTGGFRSRAVMEEALQSGAVDVVGVARPMALEADFPAMILNGLCETASVPLLRTPLKTFNGAAEAGYYSRQIQRLADGLESHRGLSPLWSALGYVLGDVFAARAWARRRRETSRASA